eukprot:TRINITY_DN15340_c0_g1_i3.p1 TRINITY_DN15340_c0_g1~~TRINITY_DN15340_c0_g1_i3.p1  ORF type:complete len:440 (-),score=106.14 TRINITY_DN15340_c0_g1_i3:120-1439(-)
MYNAITSMAGGITDQEAVSQATAALYVCFTLCSLGAAAVLNILGPRITLFLGTLGYILFVLALLHFKHSQSTPVLVTAGALNGVSAALLWTAQGSLCMCYPTASCRGLYLSVFWCIFNSGAVLGSMMSMAANWQSEDSTEATDGTFLLFALFMCVGSLLPALMTPPENVVKEDGSRIQIQPGLSLVDEASGILKLFVNRSLLMLAPLFVYSNFFYTFHFSLYNNRLFTVRAQGFNNIFYWGSQMAASFVLGKFLDDQQLSPRKRALWSLTSLAVLGSVTWLWCWVLLPESGSFNDRIDLNNPAAFVSPFLLYVLWGVSDAGVQCWSYWVMANLESDPAVLSRYSGFYKAMQSSGGALAWGINGSGSFDTQQQLYINCALFALAMIPSFWVAASLQRVDVEHAAASEAAALVTQEQPTELPMQELHHSELDGLTAFKQGQ